MNEFIDFNLDRQSNRAIDNERFKDLDLIQEYIKQDLDQNEYFKYEHDLDFQIDDQFDEFNEYINEEPSSFDRYQNIHSHTLHAGKRMLQQHKQEIISQQIQMEQQQIDEDEKDDISFDSKEEQFQIDDEDNPIYRQKAVSIFTLNRDYFELENNQQLLFKNTDILNSSGDQKLSEFYSYLSTLDIQSKKRLNQQSYDMLIIFVDTVFALLNQFESIFKSQTRWLQFHPTIPIMNIYQAFNYQWDKFQDQTYSLIQQSSLRQADMKFKAFKIEEDLQLISTNKNELCLNTNLLDEKKQDSSTNFSTLESIIPFKVIELTYLNQNFLHVCSLSIKSQQIQYYFMLLKSRFKLYKLISSAKAKLAKKQMKQTLTKKAQYQQQQTTSIAEQVFSQYLFDHKIEYDEIKLENQQVCLQGKNQYFKKKQMTKNCQTKFHSFTLNEEVSYIYNSEVDIYNYY